MTPATTLAFTLPPALASEAPVWGIVLPGGEGGKRPLDIRGTPLDVTRPDRWAGVWEAAAAVDAHRAAGRVCYLARRLVGDVTCIDLDNPEGKPTTPEGLAARAEAEAMAVLSGAWCETSLSGKGRHLWLSGTAPDGVPGVYPHAAMEVYTRDRMIIVTGYDAPASGDVGTGSELVWSAVRKAGASREAGAGRPRADVPETGPVPLDVIGRVMAAVPPVPCGQLRRDEWIAWGFALMAAGGWAARETFIAWSERGGGRGGDVARWWDHDAARGARAPVGTLAKLLAGLATPEHRALADEVRASAAATEAAAMASVRAGLADAVRAARAEPTLPSHDAPAAPVGPAPVRWIGDDTRPRTAPAEGFISRSIAEVCADPLTRPPFLIGGYLRSAGLTFLVGQSAAGKSTLASTMAWHVVTGTRFLGRKVAAGALVLYVAAEDADGAVDRMRANAQATGLPVDGLPYHVIEAPVQLAGLAGEESLLTIATEIANLRQRYPERNGTCLLVIDTLAASAVGANENSAEEMGPVVQRLNEALQTPELREALGPINTLVTVHRGKDVSKGIRGWSGITAAGHTLLELNVAERAEMFLHGARAEDRRTLFASKQRGCRAPDPKDLILDVVELGRIEGEDDEDGRITAAVMIPADDMAPIVGRPVHMPAPPSRPKWGVMETLLTGALWATGVRAPNGTMTHGLTSKEAGEGEVSYGVALRNIAVALGLSSDDDGRPLTAAGVDVSAQKLAVASRAKPGSMHRHGNRFETNAFDGSRWGAMAARFLLDRLAERGIPPPDGWPAVPPDIEPDFDVDWVEP